MKQNFKRGFTLIEILVASTILVMVLIMVSASFAMSSKWQKQIKENQAVTQSARTAMGKITQDLRNAKTATVSDDGLILDIVKNDDSKIEYQIDEAGQKLLLKPWDSATSTWGVGSELIDSSKVLVKTDSIFFTDSSNGLSMVNLILSAVTNDQKETTFTTGIKVGEFNQ